VLPGEFHVGGRYTVITPASAAANVFIDASSVATVDAPTSPARADAAPFTATPARAPIAADSSSSAAGGGGGDASPFATPTSASCTALFTGGADAPAGDDAAASLALSAIAVARLMQTAHDEFAAVPSLLVSSSSSAPAAGASPSAALAAAAAAVEHAEEAAAIAAGPRNGVTHMYKVLVVGNAKCGKTSLIQRYVRGSFQAKYETTIGADYSRKVVPQADGSHVHLQLWDLAGQDRFAKLTRPYYRNARAAIVVCDISRPETLTAVRDWKSELDAQFELGTPAGRARFPVVLLMNKSDLLDKSVDELLRMGQQLERLKNELGFTAAFTTSAKECRYVKETMECVVSSIRSVDAAVEAEAEAGAIGATVTGDDEDDIEALLARGSALTQRRAGGKGAKRAGAGAAAGVAAAAAAAAGEGEVIDLAAPTLAPGQQASCCY
jgi:small GTP-binding protein